MSEVFTAAYADQIASISVFKRNPARIMSEAGEGTVLVLNHNEPAFYCVEPALFESMMERLEDDMLGQMAQERWEKGEMVEIDFDDL